ncbi:uncharacterized protein LOC131315212 [Rhododendron vialii]|uniref:uncharacterized protein LOC131315212 n=1 Tax=Rhododendron vialii TaxID=182163 RepID=UPI00265DE006|nr:uncharacterized protein LOC131315212 [Rhododendron vialii]
MAKFKRVAEAFDEAAAKARRLCGGDQYSPPETAEDLSDLVKSFMERGEEGGLGEEREGNSIGSESDGDCSDWELRDELSALLGCGDDDQVKRNIREEVEKACGGVGNGLTSPGFKRRVVARLRDRGFDAGLCKSKWDRIGRFPSGSHEYMDVTVSGTRYIIEFSLSDEFSIARATECFSSLLQLVPPIFVGKVEELKQVVRLLCNAIKVSMRSMDMHVPPWRRFGYMKAKWFGSDFERTTGKVTVEMSSGPGSDLGRQRSVGFGPVPLAFSYHCREDFASKVGLKVGQLAVAFDGANILL